ncbi:MAG: hypothetical protein EOM28_08120 [Clostridia bacterium]|nr:hypothetical protein [Clostridia bacterium]
MGAAQTRLLFEKSKAKNFYTKPHIYAVLDGYGYHGVAGFCVANVSDPITAQDRADGVAGFCVAKVSDPITAKTGQTA